MTSRIHACIAALLLVAGCATVSPGVPFEVGATEFHGDDRIVIEEVVSDRGDLSPGATVTVRGRYRLASREVGTLYFGTTTRGQEVEGNVGGRREVSRGSGQFELEHRIPAPGYLHVTFYDVESSAPFGGTYFGRGDSLLTAKSWSYSP